VTPNITWNNPADPLLYKSFSITCIATGYLPMLTLNPLLTSDHCSSEISVMDAIDQYTSTVTFVIPNMTRSCEGNVLHCSVMYKPSEPLGTIHLKLIIAGISILLYSMYLNVHALIEWRHPL